jgi:hypothetical protein
MELDEKRIQQIVDRVVSRLGVQPGQAETARAPAVHRTPTAAPSPKGFPRGSLGVFPSVDAAARAARQAFEELSKRPLELRYKIVAAMREVTLRHVRELSEYAVAETKIGRVEDKVRKNTLAAEKTPGPEMLEPKAWSGDRGLTLIEWAPYGVIGSITPTTNPTETIVCNGIGFVAGGNTGVFNVHPSADHRCRAHDRVGPGAHEAPADADPRRHRRPGGGAGGDELGQEGGGRRTGEPAGGGRRDGGHKARRARHHRWRFVRQQLDLLRRERGLRGLLDL